MLMDVGRKALEQIFCIECRSDGFWTRTQISTEKYPFFGSENAEESTVEEEEDDQEGIYT